MHFSGNFSIEGTGLKLDPGGLTKKACEGSGEDDFVSALIAASQFKVNRDKLTLMDGAKELMSFIPQKKE